MMNQPDVARDDAERVVLPPNLPQIYARYIRDIEEVVTIVPASTLVHFDGKLRFVR